MSKSESRATVRQINIRLTEDQYRLLDDACSREANTYGKPTIGRFLLAYGLEAARRITGIKAQPGGRQGTKHPGARARHL